MIRRAVGGPTAERALADPDAPATHNPVAFADALYRASALIG